MIRGALMLAAAAAAIVLTGRDEPEPAAPGANELLVRVHVGESLIGLTAGTGGVWVNDFGREQLLRLGGESGRVLARFPLGRRIAIAADRRGVWALRWGGRSSRTPSGPLYRIDPATNRVTLRLPLDREQIYFGVLSGAGATWVWGPRHVVQIEPYSGFVARDYDVPVEAGELTGAVLHGDGLLATAADGRLFRLGPEGALPGPRAAALAGAELLAVDRGIALAATAGALVAVDARTGRLRWRRPLGFRISTVLRRDGILLAHGAAFNDPGDRLWAVDPASGRVLASTVVPSFGTTSMAAATGGSLWFATAAGEVIVVPPLLVRLFLARARAAADDLPREPREAS